MKTKLLALMFATALVTANADVNYPSCTGLDCTPQCGQNCAPPAVQCPQSGPPWCPPVKCNGSGCSIDW